jgi:hypothetical protein
MSDSAAPADAAEIARRGEALAERRRQHLLELHRSGRWRRYYSEDQLLVQMRDIVREIARWRAQGSGKP